MNNLLTDIFVQGNFFFKNGKLTFEKITHESEKISGIVHTEDCYFFESVNENAQRSRS